MALASGGGEHRLHPWRRDEQREGLPGGWVGPPAVTRDFILFYCCLKVLLLTLLFLRTIFFLSSLGILIVFIGNLLIAHQHCAKCSGVLFL